jgi:hypothetical protein
LLISQLTQILVVDGTPRDCAQASCGSQDDTAVIRTRELGTAKASALGRTKAGGPVDPAINIAAFMGGDANATDVKQAREIHFASMKRRSLVARQRGGGTKTPAGTKETGVKALTGAGSVDGKSLCFLLLQRQTTNKLTS